LKIYIVTSLKYRKIFGYNIIRISPHRFAFERIGDIADERNVISGSDIVKMGEKENLKLFF
jgi:hypothetical protein